MIRRITALVTALIMTLLLSVTVFAADNPGGDHGLLIDERDVFTSDEEDKINDLLLTTVYGLLPVWFLNYTYRGKDYPFAMNGQTGTRFGILPVSRLPRCTPARTAAQV